MMYIYYSGCSNGMHASFYKKLQSETYDAVLRLRDARGSSLSIPECHDCVSHEVP